MAATPETEPDRWLSNFSVTWIGVPRAARFVANVRRRSCKVQGATPSTDLSNVLFRLLHPFTTRTATPFLVSRAGGNTYSPMRGRASRTWAAMRPNGKVCERLFLVASAGKV